MSIQAPEVQRAPTKPPPIEGPSPPTRTSGRNLWVVAVIVALVAGLVGGYFLRWGTEPTKTATNTVTETVAPPATEEDPLDPTGDVVFVAGLVATDQEWALAHDPTTARVDRFMAAARHEGRPNPYWNAGDSGLWSWNAWLTPDVQGDPNRPSRIGPVFQQDDLVAFRVAYGTGFEATWVQEWSTTKDVVVRMWIMP